MRRHVTTASLGAALAVALAATAGAALPGTAHVPGATHTDYAKDGWRATKGMATGLLPDTATLAQAVGTTAVQNSDSAIGTGQGIDFPASVDFSQQRVIAPSATGYPPSAAAPSAAMDRGAGRPWARCR